MRKYFKKLSIVLLSVFALFLATSVKTNAKTYSLKVLEEEFRIFDGLSNVERMGTLEYLGQSAKVRFNLLEYDVNDPNIHLVTISDYRNHATTNTKGAWGMTPLEGMIKVFKDQYPNIEVLGGVNGDFYDINNTGAPTSNFIQNYEVLKGNAPQRQTFIIREDGSLDVTTTKQLGYEVLVIDKNNEVKLRKPVDFFNTNITSNEKIGVYVYNFEGTIGENIDRILINSSNIKFFNGFQFAKGNPTMTAPTDDLEREQFVVTGSELKEILEPTDNVIVQYRLEGFENVRSAIGGSNHLLLDNGEIPSNILEGSNIKDRHPRTAVGIKEDGTAIFFVANGRDNDEGVPGVTMAEIARILKAQGAVKAMNLDGGGSSTMLAKDFDGKYHTLNKLSDGRMRSVSNGILIVRGDIPERPVHITGEDTRPQFATPSNIYIDSNDILRFNPIEKATRYVITINGKEYETSQNSFDLNGFKEGVYQISVRTKGNYEGKTSVESQTINYRIQTKTTKQVLEWLVNFAKNNN